MTPLLILLLLIPCMAQADEPEIINHIPGEVISSYLFLYCSEVNNKSGIDFSVDINIDQEIDINGKLERNPSKALEALKRCFIYQGIEESND